MQKSNWILILLLLGSTTVFSQSKWSAGVYADLLRGRQSYRLDSIPTGLTNGNGTKIKTKDTDYKILHRSFTFSLGARARYDLTKEIMLQAGFYYRNFFGNQYFNSFFEFPFLARYYVYEIAPIRYYAETGFSFNLRNPLSSVSDVSGFPATYILNLGGTYQLSTTLYLDIALDWRHYFTRDIFPVFRQREWGIEVGLNYYFHSYDYIKRNCPKVYH